MAPVATFDFGGSSSSSVFSFGAYSNTAGTYLGITNSMPTSGHWALNVSSIAAEETSSNENPWYPSVLDSDFPFVTLPPTAWSAYSAQLSSSDFVCFKTAYQEIQKCYSSEACSMF